MITMHFKLILILILFITLVGCEQNQNTQGKRDDSTNISFQIYYFKDLKTNLCFGWSGNDSRTLTNVPCTPEVEALIKK